MKKKEHKHTQVGKGNAPRLAVVASPDKWKYYGALVIILLISLIVYFPVLQNGFVWDDKFYIENNPLIYSFNLKEIISKYVVGNYHPFTILILAVEYHFFGLNATGYHAVNLLLHLLNVILVFYAILLLSDKFGVALVTALLFGVHPMHVESVAWAAELKDLLYTFFFLASYIFYLKYLKNQFKSLYFFALLLFMVSLLSKAMAASLPVLLMLTDYFKGRKIDTKTILEKAPFFLLAIVFGIVAILAQKSSGAVQDMTVLPIPQRLVFASYGFITYLWKFVLPIDFSVYYPYPIRSGGNIPAEYYIYLIAFIALIASVIYSVRYTKKIFFGFGFFSITVFLVLQLLPIGGTIMADRYSYIPSIGMFYLAGEVFNYLWDKKIKILPVIILSAFTVFFSIQTYARCGVWKSEITLWNDVINQYQTIPHAYYNRGVALMDEKKYDLAIDDFNKAIALKPNYTEAFTNRGNIYSNNKKYDLAISDYSKAIALTPKYAEAYTNRGIVYMNENKYSMAIDDFTKAIELNPKNTQVYYNRGNLYMNENKYDLAISDYSKSIALNPNFKEAYVNRGNVFSSEKRYEEAIVDYSQAIALDANFAIAFFNRGLAEYNSGKKDAACMDLKKAVNLGYKPAAEVISQKCK